MKLRLFFTLSLVALALVIGMLTSGCAHPPPNLTPAANQAFTQHQVQGALDELRDIAQAANATTPPLLSTDTTRKITTWHAQAITLIHDATAGWPTLVATSLDVALADLPPNEARVVAPYVPLIKTLLKEVK